VKVEEGDVNSLKSSPAKLKTKGGRITLTIFPTLEEKVAEMFSRAK
jgi:hypothetical protein